MGRQRHTAEQSVGKLREVEILLSKWMPMEEDLRQLGVSDVTYYKGGNEYGASHGSGLWLSRSDIDLTGGFPFSPALYIVLHQVTYYIVI